MLHAGPDTAITKRGRTGTVRPLLFSLINMSFIRIWWACPLLMQINGHTCCNYITAQQSLDLRLIMKGSS